MLLSDSLNCCDKVAKPVPVRTIPRGRRSIAGHYSFRKETLIQFESTLERDFLVGQEFNLWVADVVPQPCRVPFRAASGRSYQYTPDFLVLYRTDMTASIEVRRPSMLVEVKPAQEWRKHWREWLPKWKAARRLAIENGWLFKVMDESRIRTLALTNINFLRRYRDLVFPKVESDWIVANLRELGAASFDYLLARHFPSIYAAEGVAHLWHLLATRRLECDICLPLNGNTQLWVPGDY